MRRCSWKPRLGRASCLLSRTAGDTVTFNGGGRSRCWERQPGLMPVSGTCSRWPSGTPAGRAEVAEEDGGRSVRQAHRPRPSRAGCPPPARRPQSLAAVACCAASPLCDWEVSAFSKGSPRSGAVHFFEQGKNRSLVEFGKMQSAPIRDARDTARAGGSVPRQGKRAGGRAPVGKASGSLRAPCQLGGKARRLRLGSRPVGAMLGGTPSEACSGGASSRRF